MTYHVMIVVAAAAGFALYKWPHRLGNRARFGLFVVAVLSSVALPETVSQVFFGGRAGPFTTFSWFALVVFLAYLAFNRPKRLSRERGQLWEPTAVRSSSPRSATVPSGPADSPTSPTFAPNSPLAAFDPAGQALKKGRERGLSYGAAGIASYEGLCNALKAVTPVDANDSRLPATRRRYAFADLIEEMDFFLGQSAAQGTAWSYEILHGVFVHTSQGHDTSEGLEIAKVNDDMYWLWQGRHDPTGRQSAAMTKSAALAPETTEVDRLLFNASENGDIATVKAVLEQGANVDHTRSDGMTALHAASWGGHMETVRCLLAAGASPSAADAQGWTPLHYAAKGHNSKSLNEASKLEVVRLLVSVGAERDALSAPGKGLDSVNYPGVTPRDVAMGWDYTKIANYLDANVAGTQTIPIETMTDDEMVAKLIDLASYYATGGTSAANPALVSRVMKIGEILNERGGLTEMRRVFDMLPPMQGKRTVEMEWDGIGSWRG